MRGALLKDYCNLIAFDVQFRLYLQAGIPDPPEMKASLTAEKEKQRLFLEQLMDSSKLEDYKISIPVDAQLRKYQQVSLFCVKIGFLLKNLDIAFTFKPR